MKNILIVCNHFAPESVGAAARPTKFAKHLKSLGYNVTAIAEKRNYVADDPVLARDIENITVHRVKPFWLEWIICKLNMRFRIKKRANASDSTPAAAVNKRSRLMRFARNIRRRVDDYNQRVLAKKAVRLCSGKKFDVIITSYPSLFSFHFGLRFKKKGVLWIADLRDPPSGHLMMPDSMSESRKRKILELEQAVYQSCDFIFSVSNFANDLIPQKFSAKKIMLPSGFDVDDKPLTTNAQKEKLRFNLTGLIYSGTRDYSAVFQSIYELASEEHIEPEKIIFIYTGPLNDYQGILLQAAKYESENLIEYKGLVSRFESMSVQSSCSILLIGDYDEKERPIGVRPAKTYEYILAGKPIIATVNGDIENAELSQIINECNLGFSFEYSQREKHFPLLKEFILRQYNAFFETGDVIYSPNREEVAKYDYRNLVKKIAGILEGEHV